MKNRIGLVLSGGGVRGMAHVGLLKAFEENGIQPRILSGTSAGALTAALYAAGHSVEVILTFFKTTPLFKFSFYSANKPGLLDSEKYKVFFEKYFPKDDFSALDVELHVTATDLVNAKDVAFNEGILIRPLLASAAIPPLFSPIQINGALYSDGGIMNNFPIEPIREKCDFLIGSYCNPLIETSINDMSSTTNLIKRATELRFYTDSKQKFSRCDYLFEPKDLSRFSLLDTKSIDVIYKIGYESAVPQIPKIKEAISQHSLENATSMAK